MATRRISGKKKKAPAPVPATQNKMEKEGALFIKKAESLVVSNDQEMVVAAGMLKSIKAAKQRVEDLFGPQAKSAYAAWQTALAQKKRFEGPLKQADKAIRATMSDYQIEQERKEEEALKKAAAEAAAEEEAQRKALDKKIKAAEKKGDTLGASILEEEKEEVYVPVMTPDNKRIKPQGVVAQGDIKIEVTDTTMLLRAILDGGINLNIDKLVNIKTSIIKAYVRATGVKAIPGVNVRTIKKQLVK